MIAWDLDVLQGTQLMTVVRFQLAELMPVSTFHDCFDTKCHKKVSTSSSRRLPHLVPERGSFKLYPYCTSSAAGSLEDVAKGKETTHRSCGHGHDDFVPYSTGDIPSHFH